MSKITVDAPLNGPSPGCCTPFPEVRFVDGDIISVFNRHRGRTCAGYREPVDVRMWNRAVSLRPSSPIADVSSLSRSGRLRGDGR